MDLIESKWAHDSYPNIEQDFVDLIIKDEDFNNTFQMVKRVNEKIHTSASTSGGIAGEWDQKWFVEVGGPHKWWDCWKMGSEVVCGIWRAPTVTRSMV